MIGGIGESNGGGATARVKVRRDGDGDSEVHCWWVNSQRSAVFRLDEFLQIIPPYTVMSSDRGLLSLLVIVILHTRAWLHFLQCPHS